MAAAGAPAPGQALLFPWKAMATGIIQRGWGGEPLRLSAGLHTALPWAAQEEGCRLLSAVHSTPPTGLQSRERVQETALPFSCQVMRVGWGDRGRAHTGLPRGPPAKGQGRGQGLSELPGSVRLPALPDSHPLVASYRRNLRNPSPLSNFWKLPRILASLAGGYTSSQVPPALPSLCVRPLLRHGI